MVNSPYESSYQQSYKDVYECVMDINRKLGGKAIAAGGYGCVFRPALKCKGDNERKQNTVSKLLTNVEANAELNEIQEANRMLSNIPNYQKYFAVTGYDTCVPAEVEGEDAVGFGDMCASPLNLKGNNQQVLNKFNSNLQKYTIIHSPDLGIDMSKALKMLYNNVSHNARGVKLVFTNLVNVNKSMKELMINAIAKLPSMDYYHSDVKPANIMTNFSIDDIQAGTNFKEMKIIDFGLAYQIKPTINTTKDIPNSLVFNNPFSSLLFDDSIRKTIQSSLNEIFLKDQTTKTALEQRMTNPREFYILLEPIMENFYSNYYRRGFHSEYIGFIEQVITNFEKAYGNSDANRWRNSVKMYIGEIIRKYIRVNNSNGSESIEIDVVQYWKDAYRYNVDMWGALTTFMILVVSAAQTSVGFINKQTEQVMNGYINFIYNFIYNPYYATRPIDVNLVGKALDTISQFISNNKTSKPQRLTAKRRLPMSRTVKVTKTVKSSRPKSSSKNMSITPNSIKTTKSIRKNTDKKSISRSQLNQSKKRGRQSSSISVKSNRRKTMKIA